jgi:hypothetical protein
MAAPQNYDYLREAYGLNIGKGVRVQTPEGPGTVVGADRHVHVRLDGQKGSDPWHPSDIVFEVKA